MEAFVVCWDRRERRFVRLARTTQRSANAPAGDVLRSALLVPLPMLLPRGHEVAVDTPTPLLTPASAWYASYIYRDLQTWLGLRRSTGKAHVTREGRRSGSSNSNPARGRGTVRTTRFPGSVFVCETKILVPSCEIGSCLRLFEKCELGGGGGGEKSCVSALRFSSAARIAWPLPVLRARTLTLVSPIGVFCGIRSPAGPAHALPRLPERRDVAGFFAPRCMFYTAEDTFFASWIRLLCPE